MVQHADHQCGIEACGGQAQRHTVHHAEVPGVGAPSEAQVVRCDIDTGIAGGRKARCELARPAPEVEEPAAAHVAPGVKLAGDYCLLAAKVVLDDPSEDVPGLWVFGKTVKRVLYHN